MRTKLIASTLAVACAGAFGLAQAATMSKSEFDSVRTGIDATHSSAVKRCKALSGNAKDVCEAEANAERSVARADLEVGYRGTGKAKHDARVARAEAKYKVTREKCDDRSGADKDNCLSDARASRMRMLAEAALDRPALAKQPTVLETLAAEKYAPKK